MTDRPLLFFYDLASPYAYLAAERIESLLPEAQWVPVLAGAIFKATGRRSWALTDARATGMREVEERARERGLPPVRWPAPWPGTSLRAMRAAVYADEKGRGRAFALAAFRIHFAAGRSLEDDVNVAAAAERAGLDGAATVAATGEAEIKSKLRANTDDALVRGVFGVPTTVVGREVFWGDDRLADARAHLLQRGAGGDGARRR